jgi:phage tail-like protein
MLAEESDWKLPKEIAYQRGCLRLASLRDEGDWGGTQAEANNLLAIVPSTMDLVNRIAFVEQAGAVWNVKVRRVDEKPGAERILLASPTEVTGIACGTNGLLYVATADGVMIRDLHPPAEERFKPEVASNAAIKPFRLAADPDGGCWVLAEDGAIGRVDGSPFPELARQRYANELVRPRPENVRPPELSLRHESLVESAGQKVAAIAYTPEGGIAVVRWNAAGDADLLLPQAGKQETLPGMPFPFSIQWLDASHIAMLFPGAEEIALYEVGRGFVGDFYPLHGDGKPVERPFIESVGTEAQFESEGRVKRVDRISLPNLASHGTALAAQSLDSGDARTVWHRLYIEASIPPHCKVEVWVEASQEAGAPGAAEFHRHTFGDLPSSGPSGVWLTEASEVPFHPGILPCPRIPRRSGLFMVLLQRTGRAVSSLTGRYLHIKLELTGSAQATPEVAAVRAYASRFSYAERYLPELYRETQFGADADRAVSVPGATDFLNRFVCLFESYLTPLEGLVADSYLLTSPRAAPAYALEWLGRWVGVAFDPAFPDERRREWLAASSDLHRWRGTLAGFALALDIASGGGVVSGEIVIVENYRLRRVLATILGVDLSQYDDPLLPGSNPSGNSMVGDTLMLGEESLKEVLALFATSVEASAAETLAIERLSDELAHRVTVLVHQEVEPRDMGVIRRVAEKEKPAHVELTIVEASLPFLTGISSLIGVDTYLARKPKPGAVRVGTSRLGVWDVVTQRPSLDPGFPG